MRASLFILAVSFWTSCTVTDNKREPKIDYTFQTSNDSTQTSNDSTKNFYVTVFPKGAIKGTLILLSGFGELPMETLAATDIYKYASQSGYITFIPAFDDKLFFYLDKTSNQRLYQFIDTVFRKYNLPDSNFFIGGYSLGGAAAFQYAEQAYSDSFQLRKPTAVFGADPLLDLERQYNYMVSSDRPAKDASSAEGEKVFVSLFEQLFKTNPKDSPAFFWNISPFSRSDPNHRAIKPLVNVPLRIYNDPDINWYIENRHVDLTDLNITDAAATINWLRSMGNKRAALINAFGKGYKRNRRYPHSWSIIEGKELVGWMDNIK